MPRFVVDWSKTYYIQGTREVEADNAQQAEEKVWDELGDYTGSLQYNPDDDYVEAYEVEDA